MALRVPANRIGGIIKGQRGITPYTALRLARYFGTSATHRRFGPPLPRQMARTLRFVIPRTPSTPLVAAEEQVEIMWT